MEEKTKEKTATDLQELDNKMETQEIRCKWKAEGRNQKNPQSCRGWLLKVFEGWCQRSQKSVKRHLLQLSTWLDKTLKIQRCGKVKKGIQ